MNRLFYIEWTVLWACYCITLWMQKKHFTLSGWINDYLEDMLCLPLVLMTIWWLVRTLRPSRNFIMPLVHCYFIAILFVFVFEYILPQISQRYTSDWYDALLYIAGSTYFVFRRYSWIPIPH